MVYLRKSCLARPTAELENFICTRYLLCLKNEFGLRPLPRGRYVPVNIYALPTPISVLLWVSVRTEQNQSGGCLIIVPLKFDGRGNGPPS
jgi:hypothetical protein